MSVFFVVNNEGRFRLRLLALLPALCLLAAPFLCPLPATAADLYMYGGGGGAGGGTPSGIGGGGGGAVISDTAGRGGRGGSVGGLNPGFAGYGGRTDSSAPDSGQDASSATGGTGQGGSGAGNGATATDINGAAGGSALKTDTGTVTYDTVHLRAGQGAGPTQDMPGGTGGDGGNVTYSADSVVINTEISLIGGDVFPPMGLGYENVGRGGTVSFTAGTVNLGGDADISSGNRTYNGITGGNVNFNAGTLLINGSGVQTVSVTKNTGAMHFSVGNLELQNSLTLNLDNTAASDVTIGTVALSDNNTFTVNSVNSGAGTFTNLNVTGAGGTLAGSYAPAFTNVNLAGGSMLTSTANPLNFSTMRVLGPGAGYDGALDASGKNVLFALDGVPSGSTMLTVANPGPMDISGAALGFLAVPGGRPFPSAGYTLTLIDGKTGAPARDTIEARQGLTLRHTFALDAAGNTLIAAYRTTDAYPQTKALSEGKLAGHAFLNQGSDLIIGPGMYSILSAPKTEGRGPGEGGLIPFAVGMGGSSRYDTGSHVNVDGFSMLTGLAWRQPLNDKGSNVLVGAFFEAGWGGYDSHNSFGNVASVKGDGDISYYGGGILARYGASCGGYIDASFRAGQVDTDFSSGDLRDAVSGQKADYDSSSAYYGAHAGIGYVWSITEKASLDFSTRYLWTHQDSDSVNVSGDPVRFQAIDSQRWRTGARFAYAVNEYVAPYAGAYYDHEFDGKARATTYGYNIDAPDLKGGTGVGELGLTIKPVADSGFSMDLGVQGYTGVREGVTGSLQLKFEF